MKTKTQLLTNLLKKDIMKTKKVMAMLVLMMAGMFVSAQTYISNEEAAMLEQSTLNAESPANGTNLFGFNLYDLLSGIYYNTLYNEAHPTSRGYDLSDSNDQEFSGVPSMYMRAINDKENKLFPKYWTKPRPPRPNIDGTSNVNRRTAER